MINEKIIHAIDMERRAQDLQWGGPDHDDGHHYLDWSDYIMKQIVKLQTLFFDSKIAVASVEDVQERFIKIAALAIAGYESYARQQTKL